MLQSELLEFLERTADAAFCVSGQGEICSWSAAAEKLFGYSSSEAIGKSCYRLLQCRGSLGAKGCTPEFYARQVAVDSATVPSFDLEVRVRSGRRIWVDLSTLLFKDGRTHPRLVVHLARDITKRKQEEQLLHGMLQISKQIVAMSGGNGNGNGNGNGAGHLVPVSRLSEQEQSILRRFSDGKNSSEIARALGITLQTLRNHLHHVNEKLGTHNRLQAVMHAMHRNLI
jgi:PAS domain S-box-containing protein